jgi:hypothetical protein
MNNKRKMKKKKKQCCLGHWSRRRQGVAIILRQALGFSLYFFRLGSLDERETLSPSVVA